MTRPKGLDKKPILFLASQSARRKEILSSMKFRFKVVPSTYRERHYKRWSPEKLVLTHARGKARMAKVKLGARYVLGADTTVFCQGRVLGKPKNLKEAHQMIMRISGRTHEVYTGLCLRDLKTGKQWSQAECTRVKIKRLSKQTVQDYIERTNPYDKAGGYAIQSGPKIVESINGSYSNVVGLPRELLRKMWKVATLTR